MGVPKKIIPAADVARHILNVGFPANEQAVAGFAVLRHESGGFDAHAVNLVIKEDPADLSHLTLDKGMAQFNTRWWPDVSEKEAFTWEYSVEMMYLIWTNRGFQDWASFKNLAYLRHVPLAYETFSAIGVSLPK